MTKELQTIDYSSAEIVKTMQATVAKGTTPAEFALFVQYCKATGLNPFKKEIWCIKANQGLQIMTGINGFWAIANASKDFDGAEVGLINAQGEWVKTVPDASFIGAWCKVYRKDRRIPMEGEALLADYAKGFGLWKTAPRIMIKKVAESIALRKAFPQELNGLYTQEEMPSNFQPAVEVVEEVKEEPAKPITLAEDDLPNWDAKEEKPVKKSKKKALEEMKAYYDVNIFEADKRPAVIAYLETCKAKEIQTGIWESPVKLKKVARAEIPFESIDMDFPNI